MRKAVPNMHSILLRTKWLLLCTPLLLALVGAQVAWGQEAKEEAKAEEKPAAEAPT